MKAFQFSKLKIIIFFFLLGRKEGSSQKYFKNVGFFTAPLSGPTACVICKASAQLELSPQTPVSQGATFYPEPSAERC